MSDINLNLILAIFIGFGSTLIQSLTGFGLSIVSTPLFLMVYDPKQVVLILQVICVVINIFFCYCTAKKCRLSFSFDFIYRFFTWTTSRFINLSDCS